MNGSVLISNCTSTCFSLFGLRSFFKDRSLCIFGRSTTFIFRVAGMDSSFSRRVLIGVIAFGPVSCEDEVLVTCDLPQISGIGRVILRGFFFYLPLNLRSRVALGLPQ